jgi:hypothetical protein
MLSRTISTALFCVEFLAITACSAAGSARFQPLPNVQQQSHDQNVTPNTAAISGSLNGVAYGVTNCTSVAACIAGTNASTGPGIGGTSSLGSGITGTTKFASTSTTAAYGVFGQDSSTSGTNDAGVFGISVRGVGLSGKSTSNYGVRGTSAQSYGVFGTGVTGVFGAGTGTLGIGVYGVDTNTSGTGLYGQGLTYGVSGHGTGYGIYGFSTNGIGVYGAATAGSGGQFVDTSPFNANVDSFGVRATSTSGFGLHAHSDSTYGALITSGYIGLNSSGSNIGVLSLTPSTGFPFIVENTNGATVFYVDGSGNVHYHGVLQRFLRTPQGTATAAFDAHTVRPSIEDSGSARLVNGYGVVLLDPSFAGAVDPRYPYRVFLTAEGDSPGLYVAAKHAHQFVVRELRGGRGTFGFDYHLYGTALDK